MMNKPFLSESNNLSLAWAELFIKLMSPGQDELAPAIITVTDLTDGVPNENTGIRERLNEELKRQGEQDCHTVANTIFPSSLWNPAIKDNGKHVFDRYNRIWPKISQCSKNRRGGYFRRL